MRLMRIRYLLTKRDSYAMRKKLSAVLVFLLVGLLVASGCDALNSGGEPRVRTELVTVEIIITATPDPDSTPMVRIITATPDRTRVAIPDDIVPEDAGANGADTESVAQAGSQTGDTSPGAETTDDPGADLPPGCLLHTVEEGDAPFLIAEEYGADPFLLLQVNNLDEESSLRLRPGDTLIVPLDECPVEQLPSFATSTPLPPTDAPVEETEEATEEATPEVTEELTPTVTPTVTLAPTAVDDDVNVEILGVLNPGDVTAEGVRIRNNGSVVDVTGWTVSDVDGNEYTFPDQRIFGESELTLYTRTGQDTAVVRFWGEDEAIWQPGDVVTLRDEDGRAQATYRIEQSIELD
jgi:hypothetical protein